MRTPSYNWKRYWVPRDGSFSYDFDGFLAPPKNAEQPTYWQTDVIGVEEMYSKPCLVLLGEPGIGKSYAIEDMEARTRSAHPEATILSRNLNGYSTDSHLIPSFAIRG